MEYTLFAQIVADEFPNDNNVYFIHDYIRKQKMNA